MATERQKVRFTHYLQLASNLKRLEEIKDREGLKRLWELHGRRDCLMALELAKQHRDPLPPPDVWEPEPEPEPDPEPEV